MAKKTAKPIPTSTGKQQKPKPEIGPKKNTKAKAVKKTSRKGK